MIDVVLTHEEVAAPVPSGLRASRFTMHNRTVAAKRAYLKASADGQKGGHLEPARVNGWSRKRRRGSRLSMKQAPAAPEHRGGFLLTAGPAA